MIALTSHTSSVICMELRVTLQPLTSQWTKASLTGHWSRQSYSSRVTYSHTRAINTCKDLSWSLLTADDVGLYQLCDPELLYCPETLQSWSHGHSNVLECSEDADPLNKSCNIWEVKACKALRHSYTISNKSIRCYIYVTWPLTHTRPTESHQTLDRIPCIKFSHSDMTLTQNSNSVNVWERD